jgi:hypothetical protein
MLEVVEPTVMPVAEEIALGFTLKVPPFTVTVPLLLLPVPLRTS